MPSDDMTIYLVEDSPAIRERLLGELNSIPKVEVAGVAAGADEALAGIRQTRPQLVVLDLHLSEGSGFDVLQGLAGSGFQPLVYVVSNAADGTTRSLCQRAGATRFFDKFQELDEFFGAVESLAAAM